MRLGVRHYIIQAWALMLNIPAPEEVRTWGEYVKLFKRLNPGEKLPDTNSGMTRKEYFKWSWDQHEAEEIHRAYK